MAASQKSDKIQDPLKQQANRKLLSSFIPMFKLCKQGKTKCCTAGFSASVSLQHFPQAFSFRISLLMFKSATWYKINIRLKVKVMDKWWLQLTAQPSWLLHFGEICEIFGVQNLRNTIKVHILFISWNSFFIISALVFDFQWWCLRLRWLFQHNWSWSQVGSRWGIMSLH